MSALPPTHELSVRRDGWRLHVTLNRPRARNAMNARMTRELQQIFTAVAPDRSVRAVILRGAGGHFCAGGDVAEMAAARAAPPASDGEDPLRAMNRAFGELLLTVERAPQAVIAVVEGAVMGGGLGLVCASDVCLAHARTRFRLPETSLGIPPAQIAPFLVRRMALAQARRLAVTGGHFDAAHARALGLVHERFDDDGAAALSAVLDAISRCAPGAVAATKRLMLRVGEAPLPDLLDDAAEAFARAARGDEAAEGMAAFLAKRAPAWSPAKP